jgi:hypothetical protein
MPISFHGGMEPALRLGTIAMSTVSRSIPEEGQTSRKRQPNLPRRAVLVAAILLLPALLLPVRAALAQEAHAPSETPARIGDIWCGFDHQPAESQVQSAERALGVAPSAQEEAQEAQIGQQLYQEVLRSAGAGGTDAAAG